MNRICKIRTITSSQDLVSVCDEFDCQSRAPKSDHDELIELLDAWSNIISKKAHLIPGAVFLSLWLRKGTLKSIITKEFGNENPNQWIHEGRSLVKWFPVGIVGHWPASNVDVLPILSLVGSFLGNNCSIVRIPQRLVDTTESLLELLKEISTDNILLNRSRFVTFPGQTEELHQAMASLVDGAMIWGGEQTVKKVRALPFPSRTHIAVYGPRVSIAMFDKNVWVDNTALSDWCTRLARDVWQFDQSACSSPQIVFVEKNGKDNNKILIESISKALSIENSLHSRTIIETGMTSAIVKARITHLIDNIENSAKFPSEPDWTVLVHNNFIIPEPVQGRTLHVVMVESLIDVVKRLDGTIQTIGLAIGDENLEKQIADIAGSRGIDRLVKLGSMHIFDSPWDGMRLITPMMRLVKYSSSVK